MPLMPDPSTAWKKLLRPINLWRFNRHLDRHGCGTGDVRDPRYMGGFSNCPTAMKLQSRLPWEDTVAIG